MNPLNRWLEKKIKVRYVLLLVLIMLFISILLAGLVRHQYLNPSNGIIGKTVEQFAIFPSNLKETFISLFYLSSQIIPNRYSNQEDFVFAQKQKDTNYLLQSRYDIKKKQNTIELVELKNNKLIKKWTLPIDLLKDKVNLEKRFVIVKQIQNRIMHPFLLKDGSIIFKKYDDGPLVKIDSNSNIVWMINNIFHHSIEKDADNNFWVPGVVENTASKENILLPPFRDNAITKISHEGRILFKKSVAQILLDNGYSGLLLGTGFFEEDPLHLNEIRPTLYSTKYWQKGDLLISLRHKSTVFLYRPSTNKILWLQTGPWLNQHSPDFVDSSKISVFGNDVVRTPGRDNLIYGHNNIYIYDLATHTIDTSYNEMMRKANIRTITEGRLKVLPNKDVIIEESNYGRVLRANKKEVLWQRLNYVDSDSTHVNIGNWSRYLHRTGDCKFCLSEY